MCISDLLRHTIKQIIYCIIGVHPDQNNPTTNSSETTVTKFTLRVNNIPFITLLLKSVQVHIQCLNMFWSEKRSSRTICSYRQSFLEVDFTPNIERYTIIVSQKCVLQWSLSTTAMWRLVLFWYITLCIMLNPLTGKRQLEMWSNVRFKPDNAALHIGSNNSVHKQQHKNLLLKPHT